MRVDGAAGILAATAWLPAYRKTVAEAIGEGLLTPADAQSVGYDRLPVSQRHAGPELAVRAGRAALRHAGVDPTDLGLVVHAWTYGQGHDFWSPAHFVAGEVGATGAVPVGIQQMCNGAGAAVETVLWQLLAGASTAPALVTTGDRFGDPGFDRWSGDYTLWYGDGGTAAVLAPASGRVVALEVLACASAAAADLEDAHRDTGSFARAPGERGPVDVRRTKKAFLAEVGREVLVDRIQDGVRTVLGHALADAPDVRPDVVVLPRLGRAALTEVYRPAVAAVTPAVVVDLGRSTGHLGAGDLLANLAELAAGELLAPGRAAVALSAGAGFTWTALVVRRPEVNR